MHTIADKKLLMLKPDDIVLSPHQLRKVFDIYELERLAESISSSGIIQPLVVRKGEDGKYILIAGQRRLRAAKIVGLRRLPCVLHRVDNSSAALYSVTENLQRANLNFFEEAAAINCLIKDFSLTQSEIAIRLGFSASAISNKLRLLKLDENSQEKIIAAGLSERHARALLRLKGDERQKALDKIIAERLSLTDTEKLIANILNPPIVETAPETPAAPIRKSAIGDIKLFANSLSKLLCTMQNAGVEAHSRKYETDSYIEYKVRIKKNQDTPKYSQLKIC